MSFFVSRSVSKPPGQDRADVFARGETAVLVIADGAGGIGDGGAAADLVLDRVREAVLDADFDLLAPPRWAGFLAELAPEVKRIGESTAVVVALAPGILVHASAGDSEAWIVSPSSVTRLTTRSPRLGSGREAPRAGAQAELAARLVVATDGLFRHAPAEGIARIVRDEPFRRVGDALIALADGSDDVAVLVAER